MRLIKGEIQTSETAKERDTDEGEIKIKTSETEKERDTENMKLYS